MRLLAYFLKNRLQQEEQLPSWYNSAALKKAQKAGLYAKSVNGDAFLMK
jgi:trans-2-enoyl-CoA reductase